LEKFEERLGLADAPSHDHARIRLLDQTLGNRALGVVIDADMTGICSNASGCKARLANRQQLLHGARINPRNSARVDTDDENMFGLNHSSSELPFQYLTSCRGESGHRRSRPQRWRPSR